MTKFHVLFVVTFGAKRFSYFLFTSEKEFYHFTSSMEKKEDEVTGLGLKTNK